MTILISSLPNLSMAQGRRKDEIVQQLQHPLPSRIYPPSSGRRAGRRTSNPPPKSFRHSTPGDIQARGKDIQTPPSSSTESFNPRSNDSNISFPPPPPGPPPIDIRDRDGDRRYRDDRHGRRGTDEELRFTGEFNSPKDGEK
jgi:hypothetical protein